MSATSAPATNAYTIRDLAREVERQKVLHGMDGAKLLMGLREPIGRILASDLTSVGVKREGNHIDESRYLYYDGDISITFDHMPEGKDIPPHDHGIWEALGVYSGRLHHTVYDRMDDGTKDGYAELTVIDDRMLEPGEIAIVAPPAEIHGFTAQTDDTWTVTVVGGPYKLDRAYYKPDENAYFMANPKRQKVV
jgi:predicted metal-dependent enzyme (double-stranded beta helix superfamily)